MYLLKSAVIATVLIHFISAQQDVMTGDNLNYRFFPVKGSSVSFKVNAHNDACVALSQQPHQTVPMYELVVGGWKNSKSVIRKLSCLPREKDEADTPKILNDQEYSGFWISWGHGNILVGREGEAKPFLSWQDPKPFPVSYVGVRTSWGSNGNWKITNASSYNSGSENIIDVATESKLSTQYFPVADTALHFKVRARNDVIIELTSKPQQTDPMYEVVIGGWSNTKSVIRKNVCHQAEKDQKQTPQILNEQEFREFWLRWDHGKVLVGKEGETEPFLSWQDPEPVPVAYVGVRTTWGSTGNWKLADGPHDNGNDIEVATENDPKWQFFPVSGKSMKIKVRAHNDATIGLATHPLETDPMYEVVLGGWRNTKSVLRRFCCLNSIKAQVETPQILKEGDSRGFWMSWESGNIMAGREGEKQPFISWHDPKSFPVAFLGVHTGHGSTGAWKIENVSEEVIDSKMNLCRPTLTRVRQGTACAGRTIFEENFDTLRADVWQVQQYIPVDHPELPFVSYQHTTVSVKDGNLRIVPVLQQIQPGFSHYSMFGSLDLYKGCTSGQSSSCYVDASDGATVIPPVVSGRITSRSSFAFTYGTITVRAKLPQGDWIYPEILLEPFLKKFSYGTKNSGMLKIACSRGNKELSNGATQYGNKFDWVYFQVPTWKYTHQWDHPMEPYQDLMMESHGNRENSKIVLYSGPVIDTKCHDTLLVSKNSDTFWGDGFHEYSVKWTPDSLIMSVDGEEYASVVSDSVGLRARLPKACSGPQQQGMTPFDDHFYITLGLAVGGHSEFPDACVTKGNHEKPWKNHASKAVLNFWNDIDAWHDTWQNPELLVDYVKVVAL